MRSPLAEGRELKYAAAVKCAARVPSPLAEGRELKLIGGVMMPSRSKSPLAEGRELKYSHALLCGMDFGRPSRRGVN